jgi:TP901 family phage tail tape measure protein
MANADFKLSGYLELIGVDARAAINDLNAKLANVGGQALSRQLAAGSKGANETKEAVKNLNREIRVTTTSAQDFADKAGLALRRFSAFTIAAGVTYGAARLVIGGLKQAAQFERDLIRVQQVTNASATSINDLRQEIARLGSDLAAPAQDLVNVAKTLSQAGLTINEVKTILEGLARTRLAATFGTTEQTAQGVIAIMGQFKIRASEVQDALALTNATAAKFAVESGDLITAVRQAGGAFATASEGIDDAQTSLAKFYALYTSVRQTTRQSPETIATGIKTLVARLQRPSTTEYLRDIGVDTRDQEGKFIGVANAIQKIQAALKNVDPRSEVFTKTAEVLGGARQYGVVVPLIREAALQNEILNKSLAEQKNFLKETEIPLGSLVEKFNTLSNTWSTFARDVYNSPIFQFLSHQALDLANSLVKVLDNISALVPLIALTGGAKLATTVYNEGVLGVVGKRLLSGKEGYKRASGGYIPGSGRGDHVPVIAEPGEFMIQRSAADALRSQAFSTL